MAGRSAALGLVVAAGSLVLTTLLLYPLSEIAPAVSLGVALPARGAARLDVLGPAARPRHERRGDAPRSTSSTSRRPAGSRSPTRENWVALVVFLVAAVVASTLAGAGARAGARRPSSAAREADLAAELARLLLGGAGSRRTALGAGRASGSPRRSIDCRRPSCSSRVDGRRRAAAAAVARGRRDRDAASCRRRRRRPSSAARARRARRWRRCWRRRSTASALQARGRRDRGAAAQRRGQDGAAALGLARPAHAADGDRGGRRGARLAEARARRAQRAGGRDRARGRRLSRLVDKLLDLSRLQAGAAEPRTEWCSVEEVVRAAVDGRSRTPTRFTLVDRRDLPLIRADAPSSSGRSSNLLENAARYSGGHPVAVRARRGRAIG